MLLPLTILSVVCCVCAAQSCSSETCRLPHCACEIKGEHKLIARADIPQMVLFTFDDYVSDEVFHFFPSLFRPSSKNPNGCPISATFFVSHFDGWGHPTNYTYVTQLYRAGHEIGSHSVTHRMPQTWWRNAPYDELRAEMEGQRYLLTELAGIPESDIHGFRMPYLELGGDAQFQMMADVGFQYDATFMSSDQAWPFTLDYPPANFHCGNRKCPGDNHPGIWAVPMNPLTTIHGETCIMSSDCSQEDTDKDDVLEYLWRNFNNSRNGNGEPFGVNMHADWFLEKHQFEAMQSFVDGLVELDDVYIVSVHQALEWMRSPCRLQDAIHFDPWKTSCRRITTEQATSTYPKWGWGIANQVTAAGDVPTILFRVFLMITCCAFVYYSLRLTARKSMCCRQETPIRPC